MNKKLAVAIAIVLILGIIAYYQYQKATAVKNLEIGLAEITASEFTLTSFKLGITFNIHNPNKMDVTIGRFTAKTFANNVQIAEITLPDKIKLASGITAQEAVSIRINYLDAGIAVFEAIKNKKATWQVKGKYEMELPLGIIYPFAFDVQKTWSPNSQQ